MNAVYVLGSMLLAMGVWVGGMQFGFNQARKDIAALEKQRESDLEWRTDAKVQFALINHKLDEITKAMPKREHDLH